MGEEPLVKTAASIFQDLCYNYRDQLSAGIICAGWDKRKGGQVGLEQMPGGTMWVNLMKQPCLVVVPSIFVAD